MASLVNRPNGHIWIQFRGLDKTRKTVRLGKIPERDGHEIRRYIEYLVSAKLSDRAPDDSTSRWLASIPATLRAKLAATGLVANASNGSLVDFLDAYFATRDVKKTTTPSYRNTRQNLLDYFGADRPINSITQGDAIEFRTWLATKANRITGGGLAVATVSRRIRMARQFFGFALAKQWMPDNPFNGVRGRGETNPDRLELIPRETIYKVLEATQDVEFRFVVAAARFAGLRCPSEINGLLWEHVNWETDRIRIKSPKTGWREIPIFSELRPYLQAVWDASEPGQERVLVHTTLTGQAISSKLHKCLRRARVIAWPRLWQNLRATCETELAERYPIHVVTGWIGNSPTVAIKHYLQIAKEHFQSASSEGEAKSEARGPRNVKAKQKTKHGL